MQGNWSLDIKKDFPIFSQPIGDKPLVYLDSAATTQKPKQVLEALKKYYETFNGNPHRGAHHLSVMATQIYEEAREKVKNFIGATSTKEIIFTRNATESLNMLAYTYAMDTIGPGDEILLSILEHHSNLVPWQQVAKAKNATLKYLYVNEEGILSDEEIEGKITEKTKLVSITYISNALGTINPVKKIIDAAHEKGAAVILDASQSIPHRKVDVTQLDADFLVFSGHKMLGPMGIGVLYGKEALLEKMSPFLYGGDMISYVYEQETSFSDLPHRLEAGTQNVAAAHGLAAAIDYLETLEMDKIEAMEQRLLRYALSKLQEVPSIVLYGPRAIENRSAVISFNVEDIHPHDTASILDAHGVAVRAGHHCAQPLMRYLNIPATARASFYVYNTKEDIDIWIESLKNVRKWFGYGS